MEKIYFLDEEHKKNFKRLQFKFPASFDDPEYRSACYISAVPMLFYKYEDYIDDMATPLDWFIDWQKKNYQQEEDESDEDYQERVEEANYVDYDLTSSMQQLGKLGLNLWNGYDYFNLMDCLGALDSDNIKVLKTAIDIRLGHR